MSVLSNTGVTFGGISVPDPWNRTEVEMKLSRIVLAVGILALAGLYPLSVGAQERTREPVSHEHLISGSPLALLADAFHAEYETKLKSTLTAGISGGWVDYDHQDHTGIAGFLRFYPQRTALTGFYLGAHTGLYQTKWKNEGNDKTSNGLGIGLDVGYGWLLGPSRAFFVGIGTGVTRRVTGESGTFPIGSILNVGIAF